MILIPVKVHDKRVLTEQQVVSSQHTGVSGTAYTVECEGEVIFEISALVVYAECRASVQIVAGCYSAEFFLAFHLELLLNDCDPRVAVCVDADEI